MLYVSILQISVLLDYKFISIGSIFASSATFVISLTFLLIDVIAEVYGYQRAKEVTWFAVICLIFFSIIGFFLEKLPTPVEYYQYAHAYHIILNLLFRAGISNSAAIFVGTIFNIYLVSKWKILARGKYFWLRSLCASATGELFYTLFVVSLVNAGIVSFSNFIDILLVSYLFKLSFDFAAIIPIVFLAEILKKKERIDTDNFPRHLSPFDDGKLNNAVYK